MADEAWNKWFKLSSLAKQTVISVRTSCEILEYGSVLTRAIDNVTWSHRIVGDIKSYLTPLCNLPTSLQLMGRGRTSLHAVNPSSFHILRGNVWRDMESTWDSILTPLLFQFQFQAGTNKALMKGVIKALLITQFHLLLEQCNLCVMRYKNSVLVSSLVIYVRNSRLPILQYSLAFATGKI